MLTVLIPTHNGADTIARTLAALAALRPIPEPWKLVVVNNASTDATEQIVLGWADRLPLEYMVEPRIGRSRAVNAGLARVDGDLVIFTDDDVLPDPDWLAEWRRVADAYPDFGMIGGAIEPAFEAPPPAWIDRAWMGMLFGASDPQRPEGPVEPNFVYGANMALRHSLVAKGVRFDEAFGLVGDGGILGAETSLTRQLALQGVKSLFAPSVRLRHIVHRHQFTPRWVLRRTYRSGRADFAISHPQGSAGAAELFHAPRWIVRLWLEQMLALPRAALTFDRARVMARLQRIAFHLGQIAQARRMAMAARPAGERAA